MLPRRTLLGGGLILAACRLGAPAPTRPAQPQEAARPVAPGIPPIGSRPHPRTGEHLPVLGLGDWPSAPSAGVFTDPAQEGDALAALLAGGGRMVDISDAGAEVERAAGELLAAGGVVQEAFLAARVRVPGRREGQLQMERTLQRVGRRRIDLMQVHELTDFTTHVDTLRRWRAVGHARYIGATITSHDDLPTLERELPTARLDMVQLPHSIFSRAAEERLFSLAVEHDVAVLIAQPFGDPERIAAVRQRPLPALAEELDCVSWEQLLLKWILAHPAVGCVLLSTKDVLGAGDPMHAGKGPMPNETQRRRLQALVEQA